MITRDGDLPAYIGADGSQIWYKDGKRENINIVKMRIRHNALNVLELAGPKLLPTDLVRYIVTQTLV